MRNRLRSGGAILGAAVLAAASVGAQPARPPITDPTVVKPAPDAQYVQAAPGIHDPMVVHGNRSQPPIHDPALVKAHKAAAKGRHHPHHKPEAGKP